MNGKIVKNNCDINHSAQPSDWGEFDDKGIFNITQNQHAEGVQHAYTVVKNQQNISNKESEKIIQHLMSENTYLRELLNKNLQTKSS